MRWFTRSAQSVPARSRVLVRGVTAVALVGGLVLPMATPAGADHAAPPASVTLAGSLQSELGCAADWDPACPQSQLQYDDEDGLWRLSAILPAADTAFEFKVALNGGWAQNYGAGGGPDGANLSLTMPAAGQVLFLYDPRTHRVTDSRSHLTLTAAGSFQSGLGCTGDWVPGCLRSRLTDPDGDGTYTWVSTALPVGNHLLKVARDEDWAVSYPSGNVAFNVPREGAKVTVRYVESTNAVSVTIPTGPETGDETLATNSLRDELAGEKFYFVMPDRFQDGDPTNNDGGLSGDRLVTGLDPTHKGFYHGGDLAGLLEKLDYIEGLGTTAIWMTPMFKNRPVQGEGANISAGYHGYWTTDFTSMDPHFGTNEQMQAFIAAAHAKGIKVFFDIITNHTADVIRNQEGAYSYLPKSTHPYLDAEGNEFDDRDFAGTATFPAMTLDSFPYTPVFDTVADRTVKAPAWLNDPTLYHNRGDSTFSGENSQYGDFFGLDDLFTENPKVVTGMTEIFSSWIDELNIDGYRIDTVKHVNDEFWQDFAPAIKRYAEANGKPDFFAFGEVFDSSPASTSHYTTTAKLQAVLDFPFQSAAQGFANGAATHGLRDVFAADDMYTDSDSNAYSLPTFLGNHDMGRIGRFIKTAETNAGASDDEVLRRDQLAHALMFLSRGNPVVYYGDEQGFVGDGGDQDARQDMMPSQVSSYNDDDLIGTDATTAVANFDTTHPMYRRISELSALTAAHPALRTGTQQHRMSAGEAGVYAFSRTGADRVEYVVALNNSEQDTTVAVPTYSASAGFTGLWPTGLAPVTSGADRKLSLTVPALSAVVYRADAPYLTGARAPEVALTPPPAGSEVKGRTEIGAEVDAAGVSQVTFALREQGAQSWTVLGADDNAPYRVFTDMSRFAKGTTLELKAIARDADGRIGADRVGVVVGADEPPPLPGEATPRDYLVVHYARADSSYDGWGLHTFGDVAAPTTWPAVVAFQGEDEYGRFAWLKLTPGATNVGLVVHQGETKDGGDRLVNPSLTPEVWLKDGDPKVYASLAEARGVARVHYNRPGGDYDGWGLHVWGDAPTSPTDWATPLAPTGTDAYGVYFDVPLANASAPLSFIVHRGDVKEPDGDRAFVPVADGEVYLASADPKIYPTRGAATNTAVIHYNRPAADYGDAGSPNFADYWGMHVWVGAAAPNGDWSTPVRPARRDGFGLVFEVPLTPAAPQLNFVLHRGDEKDLPGDQALQTLVIGHEVWHLQGEAGADGQGTYLLPVTGGVGADIALALAKAQWISRGRVVWNIEGATTHGYALRTARSGGITAAPTGVRGGRAIRLALDPDGLTDAEQAAWPHLASWAAFDVRRSDLGRVPEALRGQVVALDRAPSGAISAATGVALPGVLDDIYAGAARTQALGATYRGAETTVRLWAPTAHTVALELYRTGSGGPALTRVPMTRSDASGVWTATGRRWKGLYYRFVVDVWAPSTQRVETNLVTDPYSLGLSTNSTRSLFVDLADRATRPEGWRGLDKPAAVAPEAQSLYELHVRDFSIGDTSVPARERGTYRAFTRESSNGMRHLRSLAEAGLTTVHLLPTFDIATIEERRSAQATPACDLPSLPGDSERQQECVEAVRARDGFNWGYDPYHYTAPEGSYSTDPEGVTRNREYREMVAGLNKAGLRVVMDVVYNHTATAGQADTSVLDKVVPGYYQRLDAKGAVETSTCCANTATEHVMMGKLVVDSVLTWARDYKVDGFRFDLMGHHPKQNILDVRRALDALTLAKDGVDGKAIYLYGEGWNFGEVADNARFVQATQLNMAGTGVGTFNDRLRDGVRGGGPFDGNPRIQGFASGLWSDPNGDLVNGDTAAQLRRLTLSMDQIKVGLTGNLADYTFLDRTGTRVKGSQVDYNGSPTGYTADPSEAITYVDAHDNETLFDALTYKLPTGTAMADRVRMNTLGLATTALGQGVSFWHAGSEALRSKSLDRNSYDSGDWFNRVDWTFQDNGFAAGLPPRTDNEDKWPFMRPLLADPTLKPARADILAARNSALDLLRIRSASPLLHLGDAALIQQRLSFPVPSHQSPGVITMYVDDRAGRDLDPRSEGLVVVLNATDEPVAQAVPSLAGQRFRLHPVQAGGADPVVRTSSYASSSGTFQVPARTVAVFTAR